MMKYILVPAALMVLIASCKKDILPAINSASLTIVNALPNSNNLVTNFTGSNASKITPDTLQWYIRALQIGYGGFSEIPYYSGSTPLLLAQITDTTHSVFNGVLDLPANTIHSLFVTGALATPDTLFTLDNPPYHNTNDSTIGIRFVNLSAGSSPVSVDIKGLANGSEVASLDYKGITQFRNYNALTSSPASYIFEFRDANTGALISASSSYSMSGITNASGTNTSNNNYRFRNFTIALIGTPGGTGTVIQKAILINSY